VPPSSRSCAMASVKMGITNSPDISVSANPHVVIFRGMCYSDTSLFTEDGPSVKVLYVFIRFLNMRC
jgi:hypothetical protein